MARALARYHLHPEEKFWGGDFDQHGVLERRCSSPVLTLAKAHTYV